MSTLSHTSFFKEVIIVIDSRLLRTRHHGPHVATPQVEFVSSQIPYWVVNVHAVVDRALPARSVIPLVNVTVYVELKASFADGVKVH